MINLAHVSPISGNTPKAIQIAYPESQSPPPAPTPSPPPRPGVINFRSRQAVFCTFVLLSL